LTMLHRLALTLFGATLVFAQTAPTPPDPATEAQMRVNMLSSQLGLTDAQKASAVTIYTAAFTSEQSLQTNAQSARQSLTTAIKGNDTATIEQVSTTLGTIVGQLTAINSKADASFYALLTSSQQAIYNSMPHGGPGGPGGRGGPGSMPPGAGN
jgi:Spy/CpxP family protein refolding chaperone